MVEQRFYTVPEVKELMRLKSEETVRRWVRKGKLKAIKLPGRRGRLLFPKEYIDSFIREREKE